MSENRFSRRDVLKILGGTALGAGAVFGIDRINKQPSHPDNNFSGQFLDTDLAVLPIDEPFSPEILQGDQIETAETLTATIIRLHPDLNKAEKFRPIFEDPTYNQFPEIRRYLQTASYEQLVEREFILTTDGPERRDFLHPHESGGMWENKCENTAPTVAERRLGGDGLVRQQQQFSVCEEALRNTRPDVLPERQTTAGAFIQLARQSLSAAKQIYEAGPTTERLLSSLTHQTLLAISTQELMPPTDNQLARVAYYRAILNHGFEPNRIPAIHDRVLSFGIFQMTQMSYENGYHGLDDTPDVRERSGGSIGYLLERAQLPARLHQCVTIEDQLLAGALHQIENIRTYIANLWQNYPQLIDLWENTAPHDREVALAIILGGCHHNPSRTLETLETITPNIQSFTIDTFPTLFLNELARERQGNDAETDQQRRARLETTEHARCTGQLIDAWYIMQTPIE